MILPQIYLYINTVVLLSSIINKDLIICKSFFSFSVYIKYIILLASLIFTFTPCIYYKF